MMYPPIMRRQTAAKKQHAGMRLWTLWRGVSMVYAPNFGMVIKEGYRDETHDLPVVSIDCFVLRVSESQ